MRNLQIGLITAVASFFLLRSVLHKRMVPKLFPTGGLYATSGTLRIRISMRLAALLMAAVRSSLCQRAIQPGSIKQIVSDVNRQLTVDVEDSGRFMTLFFCLPEPAWQGFLNRQALQRVNKLGQSACAVDSELNRTVPCREREDVDAAGRLISGWHPSVKDLFVFRIDAAV